MCADDLEPAEGQGTGSAFATTQWSVVLAAGEEDSPAQRAALEALCTTYWLPVYAYIRRRGYRGPDAEDLAQAFFHRLLTGPLLQRTDPQAGKFRCLLVVALKHFLINEAQRARAEKRGGKVRIIPFDDRVAAELSLHDFSKGDNPETLFDRQWALTVLSRAFERLQEEWDRRGKRAEFAQLKVFLSREGGASDYARLGAMLGMRPQTVPVVVHRLRRRYGELMREEIAQTVSSRKEADEEMHYLLELTRQQM